MLGNCNNIHVKPDITGNDLNSEIWKDLIRIIVCFIFVISGFISSYNIGYKKGSDYGFVTALDAVDKICEKQVNNDSIVTQLVLIKKATVAYILSSKRVLEK